MIEFTIPEDIFLEPPPEIEYTFNPVFEEEIEIVEEFNIIAMDEFFLKMTITKTLSWRNTFQWMLSLLKS